MTRIRQRMVEAARVILYAKDSWGGGGDAIECALENGVVWRVNRVDG